MTKLDILITDFNKKFKDELFTKGKVIQKCARIPFSSPRANYLLYGGIPRGRITELSGGENAGKTTACLDITGNAQKLFQKEWEDRITELENLPKPTKTEIAELNELRETGPKKCVYIDAENTFDTDWAEQLGVDVDALVFMSPQAQSAETIFDMVIPIIETGEVGLVVIDSLGVMLSQQAYERDIADKTYGGIAMALTNFSKRAEMVCAKTNCALIGVNQLRDDLNSQYGGTTTVGGRAWKHNCSVRLAFRKGDFFDEKYTKVAKSTCENPYGHNIMISVEKTKICKPDRKLGQFTLVYTEGVDYLKDYIDLAIKEGYIKQAGAWFTFVDPTTGEMLCDEEDSEVKVQGIKNLPIFLKNNSEYYLKIKQAIDNKIEEVIL